MFLNYAIKVLRTFRRLQRHSYPAKYCKHLSIGLVESFPIRLTPYITKTCKFYLLFPATGYAICYIDNNNDNDYLHVVQIMNTRLDTTVYVHLITQLAMYRPVYKPEEPSIGPSDSEGPIWWSEGFYKGRYMSPLCYKIYVPLIYLKSARIMWQLSSYPGNNGQIFLFRR